MEESALFEQILSSTEYEEICDSFKTISKLFIRYFSLTGSSPKSELLTDKKLHPNKYDLKRRLKESKEANEIIAEIKRILTVGTSENPSLKTRIRNYINRYNNRLINIDVANPLTLSLISSLVHVFESYNINIKKFDNKDEEVFINDLLNLLKNNAAELNGFLFEHKNNDRQRQPLYTIFTDENATHFNTSVLPKV